MNQSQAAKLLGVSPITVARRTKNGQIKSTILRSGRHSYRKEDLLVKETEPVQLLEIMQRIESKLDKILSR